MPNPPPGWRRAPLADIADVVTGCTPPTSDPNNFGGDVPFATPGDLSDREVVEATERSLSEKGASLARVVPAGSTLFVCIGSTIGKVARAGADMTTNQQINAAIPQRGIDARWLHAALAMRSSYVSRIAGRQAVPIVSKGEFQKLELLVPPPHVQTAIGDLADDFDRAISLLKMLVRAKVSANRALRRRLLGAPPVAELGTLSSICRPRQWPTPGVGQLTAEGVPVYGANGIIGRYPTPTHTQEVIAVGCRGSVGEVHRIGPPAYVTGNAMALDELDPRRARLPFVYHWLKHRGFGDVIAGSSQPQIVQSDMRGVSIWLPSTATQEIIGDVLDTADREVELLNSLTEAIARQKRGLMQKLLTGERIAQPGCKAVA